MGRKPHRNLNLPPMMRKRMRGDTAYYFLDTGEKPRREISLGKDYVNALRKYSELHIAKVAPSTFSASIDKYEREVLPNLATNTQRIFRNDIKHVREFFGTAPLDQIRPVHIRQFLDRHADKPTTANRCKRLFSTIFNHARAWGHTDAQNPCTGIIGHKLEKRTYYVTDEIFKMVYDCASHPVQDAMDLAYLTGQRPGDALRMTMFDVQDCHLVITQAKTKQPLRIIVKGKLAALLRRIELRKKAHKVVNSALLVNTHGKELTMPALRTQFEKARKAAIEANQDHTAAIREFRFYDLRAKAADDTSDRRGESDAADLLGHTDSRTTKKHYLRRGKIVSPTK